MTRLLILTMILLPHLAAADGYQLGDLAIAHPIIFETPPTAQTGAGYMVILNNGSTADRLIGIEADFPRVMLHETLTQNDIATMRHQDTIDIPAGGTVTFEPGGKHIMFMGLNGDPFEVGEKINVKLIFETAGSIDVVFQVEARDVAGAHTGH